MRLGRLRLRQSLDVRREVLIVGEQKRQQRTAERPLVGHALEQHHVEDGGDERGEQGRAGAHHGLKPTQKIGHK